MMDEERKPGGVLRDRLVAIRADLIGRLEDRLDGGALSLLAQVQGALDALDAVRWEAALAGGTWLHGQPVPVVASGGVPPAPVRRKRKMTAAERTEWLRDRREEREKKARVALLAALRPVAPAGKADGEAASGVNP